MFILKVSFTVCVFVMLYKRSVFLFFWIHYHRMSTVVGVWIGKMSRRTGGIPRIDALPDLGVETRSPRTSVSTGISYWPTVRVGGCRVWRSNRTVETATSSETDRLIARWTSRREARVRWGAGRKERSGCARRGVDASRRSLADAGRRAGAASGSHGEYPPYPNPPNPQLSAGHMVTALLVHSHPPSTV